MVTELVRFLVPPPLFSVPQTPLEILCKTLKHALRSRQEKREERVSQFLFVAVVRNGTTGSRLVSEHAYSIYGYFLYGRPFPPPWEPIGTPSYTSRRNINSEKENTGITALVLSFDSFPHYSAAPPNIHDFWPLITLLQYSNFITIHGSRIVDIFIVPSSFYRVQRKNSSLRTDAFA